MSLLVLRYRRARAGADGNSPEMLDSHFEHIAGKFRHVLPGDPLPAGRTSVCLCFDGAHFDFYTTVFPLLEKHDLRAMLAVSPALITSGSTVPSRSRSALSDRSGTVGAPDGFCSWDELQELVASNRVRVAAHGYSHCALDVAGADLETEMHVPHTLLATRLGTRVDSFVFPFGRFRRATVREARTAYRYVFADRNALNVDWRDPVLHRVCADNLRTPREPFEAGRMLSYRMRRLWSALIRR